MRATSLRTWERGHHPPCVAVEVVSAETAVKDYDDGPTRYAASGTRELWVSDPLRAGAVAAGGPRRVSGPASHGARGVSRRVYVGTGPAFSCELAAWRVVTDGGERLRIADDQAGVRRWTAEAEQERAAREQERAARVRAEAQLERPRALIAAREKPDASPPRPRPRRA